MIDLSDSIGLVHKKTRRQLVAGAAMVLGGLAAGSNAFGAAQQPAAKATPTPDSKRMALHYEAAFKVSPQRIYEALLDAKQFAAFTGLPAQIDPKAGGAFSLFSGVITGRNIELVTNERIVQAWRPGHWSPGVYSIVKFELKARGPESTLILDHTGFPEGDADGLDSGWHEHYLDPMQKYFV
jgi:activator of HSP90 ATPase